MVGHSWIDLPRARARLAELDGAIGGLQQERDLIHRLLGEHSVGTATAGASTAATLAPAVAARRRPGRPFGPQGDGTNTLALVGKAMRADPAKRGWTIAELLVALETLAPGRGAVKNSSTRLSSALAQALKAKVPRFASIPGTGGRSRRYHLIDAREELEVSNG